MEHPAELKYSKTHEWVRLEGNLATIGITDYAQSELGDIVYCDLPDIGRTIHAEEVFGSVESVKAVTDLYSPLTGDVTEVNEEAIDSPEIINEEPYSSGWMIIVKLEDPSEMDALMSAEEYEEFIENLTQA
ncbi:MAG TPA: glycine cleavage system protein GcvH [Armatimonadota bacterium]|nr:glycine cleavage system protein GcvH [Armatimonadota bacterium]